MLYRHEKGGYGRGISGTRSKAEECSFRRQHAEEDEMELRVLRYFLAVAREENHIRGG